MTLFSIDPDRCKRDGLCVAVCPLGLLEINDKGDTPVPIEEAEDLCIECGHCACICPHGALSLEFMKTEECAPVRKDLLPQPVQVEHFLRYRRSIRTYKSEPLDSETLHELIKTASYAPSGHNVQPVHWLVIEKKEEMQRLAGLVVDWMRNAIVETPQLAQAMHLDRVIKAWELGEDRVLRKAPHLIVAHADAELRVSQSSCTIALAYLELTAAARGLGACWAGYFNSAANFYPPMIEALALPSGHLCFGAMMIGHKKYEYQRLPLRKEPRILWR